MVWLRLSMLKIKHTDLTKNPNPTRNYEKKKRKTNYREKQIYVWTNRNLKMERDLCLPLAQISQNKLD